MPPVRAELRRAHRAGRRIKFQMELFNLHIQQGRDLCSKLSNVASVIKTPPQQLQTQLRASRSPAIA